MHASSPEPRRYRGALIGLGSIGRNGHLPAFRRADVAERLRLVATVDDVAEPVLLAGVAHLAGRDALHALGPLDFVDICTPTATHVELVLWALDRGYHVLCEKPVAVTSRDAERIARAARRARRVVMPCHQYRFNPVWQQVRRWLEEGAIGRWHLAEYHVYRPKADPGLGGTSVPWRGRRADGLGGVLLDHGTHLVYQLLDVAGPPAAVRAWTGRLTHREYDVEDSAHLLFDYGDRLATMFLTWAGRRRETRLRFIGERGTIDWTGGTLSLERDGRVESRDWSAALDKRSYADWYAGLFLAFARAVDEGDGESCLADIARVAAVLEAAYAAARPASLRRPRRTAVIG